MSSEQTHARLGASPILPLVRPAIPQSRKLEKGRSAGQRTILSQQGERRRETERKLELHRRVYLLTHAHSGLK
ncbi:hypothetical protein [Arthrobacter sp. HLT1-21]